MVNVTADLTGLGLSAAPLNDASVTGNGFFEFPVTGGDLNGLAGAVPIPASFALFAAGAGAIGWIGRRRRSRRA